jgi:hypothetical protein
MIVSTTLAGDSEQVITDALASVVDWVDACLVIDTCGSAATLQAAYSVARERCFVRKFQWNGNFSDARNFALTQATELGASWAVTVDTDERIHLNGEDLCSLMWETSANVVLMWDEARSYCKERCIRLPSAGCWAGPVHETYGGDSIACGLAYFSELRKSKEQLKTKFARDAVALENYVVAHKNEPRWWFYLGESRKNLGHLTSAIVAYGHCSSLRGWSEEAAWACYRAAECFCGMKEWTHAIERCCLGLSHHVGIAELSWLAGWASFQMGDMAQAVRWSQQAVAYGMFQGNGAEQKRLGFRNLVALYEGPYDVLRFALRRLGDQSGAEQAEVNYSQAKSRRLNGKV